jgi:phosphopantothenate synthetase
MLKGVLMTTEERIKDILNLLNEEIKWHENDCAKCKGLSRDYKDGFINGLKQAKFLITKLQNGDYVEIVNKEGKNG